MLTIPMKDWILSSVLCEMLSKALLKSTNNPIILFLLSMHVYSYFVRYASAPSLTKFFILKLNCVFGRISFSSRYTGSLIFIDRSKIVEKILSRLMSPIVVPIYILNITKYDK